MTPSQTRSSLSTVNASIPRQPQTPTISLIDLRQQPSTFLDRVFDRRESLIVERAGEPKAVIIPIREYEDLQRIKREARERFMKMTQEIQAAFAGMNSSEIEQEIATAIKEVRAVPTAR